MAKGINMKKLLMFVLLSSFGMCFMIRGVGGLDDKIKALLVVGEHSTVSLSSYSLGRLLEENPLHVPRVEKVVESFDRSEKQVAYKVFDQMWKDAPSDLGERRALEWQELCRG